MPLGIGAEAGQVDDRVIGREALEILLLGADEHRADEEVVPRQFVDDADADAMRDAIAASSGKVLAFCRSGTRSALAWALAKNDEGMAREEIERRLISAGVDPTPIAHLF